MKIEVKRHYKSTAYTIGRMYLNGKYFCDTLEDTVRMGEKVPTKTAIPAGEYQVVVNHSPRFKRDLPRILSVPYFDGILIHRGNTAEDTSGCILVGENKEVGKVINSTKYEVELVKILKECQDKKEQITIEIG